ncbi:MAG: PSD1 and planctomycete cytochrome C domain-containing protein [Bryobacteraceae bacterium]|nr:PSD1 and planctomycete cytochrome C domain-containing protein [Bryobacteraceae bacterium]
MWLIAAAAATLGAADTSALFEEKVRPLLAARCFGCHGAAKVSGLALDSREGMLAGGRLGPAIIPGDAQSSLLMQAVTHTHPRLKMPPAERLDGRDAAVLRQWIDAGAVWPAHRTVIAASVGTRRHQSFWSFVPLSKPQPPGVPGARTNIDRFLRLKQNAAGLTPSARAGLHTLTRRVHYDLTGLPPEPGKEAAGFPALVDRLLASPHFGERWARHWLDVARYAEDDVLGLSQEKYPNAWRYRDWVVEAINRDLPYDVFIRAQIAGDLMEGDYGLDLRPALGLFGLGPWHYSISPPPQARADERHDRIDTLTRGVLGLTVACARCHDHKFDPITMRDYYGLAGVFASTEYREYPLAPPETMAAFDAHQKKIRDLEKRIKDLRQKHREETANALARQPAAERDPLIAERWKKYLAGTGHEHPFLALPADALQRKILEIIEEKKAIDEEKRIAVERSKPPRDAAKTRLPNGFETYDEFCPGCDIVVRALDRDKYVFWNDLFHENGGIYSLNDEEIQRFLSSGAKQELAVLQQELEVLKKAAPPPYAFLHGIADKPRPTNLRVHLRGDPYSLGEEAPRRFLEVLSAGQPQPFSEGSGRLQLAEAVMNQPIAARVAANRIWMHLFGRPLAASPSNFGRFGERPTHPELLEYLAARLVEEKWSVKALIREILLSDAYQQSSDTIAANESKDAANQWFWRANRRRLDAEALRDWTLAAAGTLDRTVGGPSAELDDTFTRRTLYGRVSRFKLSESLQLFDFPSPSITSEKRGVTHVPLQRLFFLNNGFVTKQAEALAARAGGIDQVYRIVYGRDPDAEEKRLAEEFLRESGWKELGQVLLASNEFLFVD